MNDGPTARQLTPPQFASNVRGANPGFCVPIDAFKDESATSRFFGDFWLFFADVLGCRDWAGRG